MSIRSNLVLTACLGVVSTVGVGLMTLIRGMAFWTAVVLPALYIPLAVVEPAVIVELRNFWTVVALHVAALFVGHEYHVLDTRS